MPEQPQITATIESPPDGVVGSVSVSSSIELQPCQHTKKVIGHARPQQRTLLADIAVEKCHRARLLRPTACATAADNTVTEQSLVRVRGTIEIDHTKADVEEQDVSYYVEFDTSSIEAEVGFYWNSIAKRQWLVEATKHELNQYEPNLDRDIQVLMSLLKRHSNSLESYLIKHRIEDVEITTTRALTLIMRTSYTCSEFMEQLKLFDNSLRLLMQEHLNGAATKISLAVRIEELLR